MSEAHAVIREAEPSLRRSLGRLDLTAIGVNQVIGGAVFLVPAQIAFLLGGWSPLAVLLIGLASMPVALCFAEAGSRFETTGGAYLYAKAAFGRFAGLEVAWMQWFTRVTTLASVANGIAVAFSSFYPAAALGFGRMLLISAVVLSLMFANLSGIRQSSNLINALTIAKLIPLVGFILFAGWYIHPTYYPPPFATPENAAAAALLLVFTFGGFDVIGVQAGEARTPRRDVPIALIVVIAMVTLILTAIQTLLMFTLPDLAHSQTPIADAARILAGPAGTFIVAAGAILSMIGNNQGQILSGSRTLYALAENGELPRFLARIDRRHGTPYNAIIATTAAGLALALSGSFVRMAAISAVARLTAYVATAASVLVLRRREGAEGLAAANFRIPGGAVAPVLALTTCLLILVGATREQLSAGVIALVIGAILHLAAHERRPNGKGYLQHQAFQMKEVERK
jgi:basic amino acid/polyamine antiporter, APA family